MDQVIAAWVAHDGCRAQPRIASELRQAAAADGPAQTASEHVTLWASQG